MILNLRFEEHMMGKDLERLAEWTLDLEPEEQEVFNDPESK